MHVFRTRLPRHATAAAHRAQVQKSAPHYTDAARDEVTLLDQLRDGDPSDAAHCVRLLDHFEHAGPHGLHVCLVFEVLGDNLLALIKAYDYRGLPLPVVKNLARQMLVAVDYMHSRCSILHTDIKPENIMLADTLTPRRWELELPPAPAPAAGGGGASGGGGGGGGAGGGGLTKNQKKKAKRKQAKAAAGGGGGSDAMSGSGVTGASMDEEAGGGDEAAGPSGGGDGGGGGGAQPNGAAVAAAAAAAQQQQEVAAAEPPPRKQLVYESRVLRTAGDLATASAKIVDFGNACWLHKRFTDDVQTRQYRCPEVILGAK
jgi:serine/threonine-protein kinase SRPK3